MKIFEAELKDAVTNVYSGDVFEDFASFARKNPYRKFAVLIDENVWEIHKERLEEGFGGQKMKNVIAIPSGEQNKTLGTLETILNSLADMEMDRDDLVVAVGGGVVGDMAGFAAGIFKRGMDYVNVPTTLLAQVDSSIGGKTAVNLDAGKNLAGMIHHPKAVFADKEFLKTLGKDQLNDGMAELVKYGCIGDEAFFEFLEKNGSEGFIDGIAAHCVGKALGTKMEYVAGDEKDRGGRMMLNFGHTFAHVMETLDGYGTVSHGKAVACGMIQMARLGERKGLTEIGTSSRLEANLVRMGFDADSFTEINFGKDEMDIMKQDKKVSGGCLNMVLLKRIGEAYIHPVPVGGLEEFLK